MGLAQVKQEEKINDNVYDFSTGEKKVDKKPEVKEPEIKLKKDGTPKKIVNNRNNDDRTVFPFKDINVIVKIKQHLQYKIDNEPRSDRRLSYGRDLMMFCCGINIGLRVSDLLKLQWKDIFNSDMKTFRVYDRKKEKKTQKGRTMFFNDAFKQAIMAYIERFNPDIAPEGYLFTSRNNRNKPICSSTVDKMINSFVKACNIEGNYSTHSLRKTFAYHIYKQTNNLALVQELLNHSSMAVTRRYLGLVDEELQRAYDGLNLGI
jgi:integrase